MEDLSRMSKRQNNVLRGYEPKCKVCNSGYQKEVEHMYELNHPYKDIKSYMEGKYENVSLMSISRHFRLHYPRRKAYFDNVKIMEAECIQEAIKKCPQLEDVFHETRRGSDYDKMIPNEDKTGFKEYIWKERSVTDIFLNDKGYCLTAHRFCSNIPKRKVCYMDDVLRSFNMKLAKLGTGYSFNESKRINLLIQKIECLECRDMFNTFTLEYLIEFVLINVLGVNLDAEKFFDLMKYEAGWDFNEMNNLLNELKKSKY